MEETEGGVAEGSGDVRHLLLERLSVVAAPALTVTRPPEAIVPDWIIRLMLPPAPRVAEPVRSVI